MQELFSVHLVPPSGACLGLSVPQGWQRSLAEVLQCPGGAAQGGCFALGALCWHICVSGHSGWQSQALGRGSGVCGLRAGAGEDPGVVWAGREHRAHPMGRDTFPWGSLRPAKVLPKGAATPGILSCTLCCHAHPIVPPEALSMGQWDKCPLCSPPTLMSCVPAVLQVLAPCPVLSLCILCENQRFHLIINLSSLTSPFSFANVSRKKSKSRQ